MSNNNIVRAWKDAEYRDGLSEPELSSLPVNPVGVMKLSDLQLEDVSGGKAKPGETLICTVFVCTWDYICPQPPPLLIA